MKDTSSKLGGALKIDVANMVASVEPRSRTDIFLNDGTPAQRAGFADTMVDEPLQPPGTPVHLTKERFGSVEKSYVFTLKDQAVTYGLQKMMVAESGVTNVHTIDSGHTPFLTHPRDLAKILETVALRRSR